uniref:Uncharacterized protein n=1 Tax=Rhizophora mucronata TaxID=61149 RepID=A0A2P2N0Q3_RHIMU
MLHYICYRVILLGFGVTG